VSKQEEIQIEKSYLEGKETLFKGATFHGATFENVKNTTGAKLPSSSDLKEVPKKEEGEGFLGGLFSKK